MQTPSPKLSYAKRRNALLDTLEQLDSAQESLAAFIFDCIGPANEWPVNTLEMFCSKHLMFAGRFQLTLFMLNNGCPPEYYAEWLLRRNALRDDSARFHVAELIAKHQDGLLESKTSYIMPARLTVDRHVPLYERKSNWDGVGEAVTAQDRIENPNVYFRPVITPNCAHGTEEWRWLKAYAMLRNNKIDAPPANRLFAKVNNDFRRVQIVNDMTNDEELSMIHMYCDEELKSY